MNQYDELKALLISADQDFHKFYDKGNAAAGTRLRKTMQDIKNVASAVRFDVSAIKNKTMCEFS